MLPDRVSNPGPLTYESGALPIALRGPAMLELHTRQVYTVNATAIKRARKNEKEQLRGDKAEVPPWDSQQRNYWGGGFS